MLNEFGTLLRLLFLLQLVLLLQLLALLQFLFGKLFLVLTTFQRLLLQLKELSFLFQVGNVLFEFLL